MNARHCLASLCALAVALLFLFSMDHGGGAAQPVRLPGAAVGPAPPAASALGLPDTSARLTAHGTVARPVSLQIPGYPRDFELVYRDLLGVFVAGSQHADRGRDHGSAPDYHGQAEALFEELIHIPAAPEMTIAKLGAIDALGPKGEAEASLLVCSFGLELGLKRVVLEEASQGRLTRLVTDLLGHMVVSPEHASLVYRQLAGRRYLSVHHEQALIGIAGIAVGELSHLRRPAMELLAELWSSLQEEEGYRPQQLAGMIDEDGPVGEAALLALLLTDEFRGAVIDRLLAGGTPELIGRVAEYAVAQLPPALAVETLERLNAATEMRVRLGHAYAALASRSPAALVDSYRESLADGRSEGHRLDAVVAMASFGGAVGAAAGREAFERDPSPLIRSLALMGLGGEQDPEFVNLFEQALSDGSLMDPSVAPYLVTALRNYSLHASADAVFVAGAKDALSALTFLDGRSQARLAKVGD